MPYDGGAVRIRYVRTTGVTWKAWLFDWWSNSERNCKGKPCNQHVGQLWFIDVCLFPSLWFWGEEAFWCCCGSILVLLLLLFGVGGNLIVLFIVASLFIEIIQWCSVKLKSHFKLDCIWCKMHTYYIHYTYNAFLLHQVFFSIQTFLNEATRVARASYLERESVCMHMYAGVCGYAVGACRCSLFGCEPACSLLHSSFLLPEK